MKQVAYIAFLLFLFISFPGFAQESTEEPEKKDELKNSYAGIGVGLPYGWYGANIESNIYQRLYISVGGGIIFDFQNNNNYVGPVVNVGPSIHLRSQTDVYQPALMFLYGSNGLRINENYGRFYYDVYSGMTVGFSNNFLFGPENNNGFSIDVMAILSSKLYREHPEAKANGRFKIGVAYKHKFRFK